MAGLDADGATLVAFRTSQPIESLLPAIRDLLDSGQGNDLDAPRA
jgi:hypothetical protein